MEEIELSRILFDLSLIFFLTFAFGSLLARVRIPVILSALFVGMGLHYLPLFEHISQIPQLKEIFDFLSNLGVLFLLLYIGLQIEMKKMVESSRDIIWLTVLNTVFPFVLGMAVMFAFGYGPMIAFVIGMTRMPTAEAVIVPILDEFKMIKSRIGTFIIGAGVLDDVIEVFLVGFVSVWIGVRAGEGQGGFVVLTFGILSFILFSYIFYAYFAKIVHRFIPKSTSNLLIFALMILFVFGGFSEKTEIGMVVGAITAGVVLRPILEKAGKNGTFVSKTISTVSYGFFGIIFFFWIGFNIDLGGLLKEPVLAIALYLAGTIGKLLGVFLMVPMKKLTFEEALTIGVGLDARLTTEIIVAQLLFSSGIIDLTLFTALVAASSFTALTVPLIFTLLVRRYGKSLRGISAPPSPVPKKPEYPWHAKPLKEIIEHLHTDPQKGLDEKEALKRAAHFGPNELQKIKKTPWYLILLRQFTDILILILFVAAIVSIAVGEMTDAITIFVIILLNGILGFVQEYKADNEIYKLQQLLTPECKVIRDGKEQIIDSRRLVPGDVVVLEIGDRVPADLRLIEANNLKVDESSLTGESLPVNKSVETVMPGAPLALQKDMVWMGTTVVNGLAKGIVVRTGMETEFGKIAELTQTVERKPTPLQKKLALLGKRLGVYSVLVAVLVALIGWMMGKDMMEMFLTGVSLAVAVVPEGLPAVVTITLALGIRALVRQNALLRRLQAAETLGSATVLCSDKTGTITQNEMTVKKIWLPSGMLDVTGIGYDPAGHFEKSGKRFDYKKAPDLQLFLKTGLVCSHAKVTKEKNEWKIIGEPTEASLIVAAYKAWMSPKPQNVVTEFSFNSIRKRMSIVVKEGDHLRAYVKGAPEVILERSTHLLVGEKLRPIDKKTRQEILTHYKEMASEGLRTLAMAYRDLPSDTPMREDAVEKELVFLGIAGIIDPPHKEAAESIAMAKEAGVKVIMITGDSADTALAIAKKVGLDVERAYSSEDVAKMDDNALKEILERKILFARARPEDKLRIVKNLQQMHHIVGMTGDGVNDAPALKQADIGIAMGKKGTDVAKAAADMVLLDDNFATIIRALKEGRRQYDNVKKFVTYLFSSNTGEVIAIFMNIVLGGPMILLPVQILWMNLVTDGMTAVALGLEPAEKGIMKRPPRPLDEPILGRWEIGMIAILGVYIGLVTLWLHHYYLSLHLPNGEFLAQTVAFTGIVILEKMNVFNYRSFSGPIVKTTGFFSNRWVLLAIAITIGLQACAVYLPFLQQALHTVPLGWREWGIIFVVSLPIYLMTETFKWIRWKMGYKRRGS
ncbi:MAG: ATPase [Campylobacteraceae bacterium 4484_4]|nr:MAG: ATPase [Campylobacteraceae bacterium 4484_4]